LKNGDLAFKNTMIPISKLQKKLDKLIQRHYVKENPYCFVCGKNTSEMHHFIQKSQSTALRFNEKNLIPLCRGCHFGIHTKSDPEIVKTIIDKKGEKWFNYIKENRRKIVKKNKEYSEELKRKIKQFTEAENNF
jgi:hypothetical protein